MSSASKGAKTTLNDEQRAAVITYKCQNPYASNIDLVNWIRETLAIYLVQQDINDVVRLERDRGLVQLSKVIKQLKDASRKQTNITSFLQ